MSNPLRQLTTLPWRSLVLVALLTLAIAGLLDLLLLWGNLQLPLIHQALGFFLVPPWGLLISAIVGLGLGALAVYVMERWFQQQILIYTSTLWALLLCLIMALALRSLLPVPGIFVGLSQPQAIGMLVGVFWKGRPYWQ